MKSKKKKIKKEGRNQVNLGEPSKPMLIFQSHKLLNSTLMLN